MNAGSVTLRYATALFELARDKGVLPAVEADVEVVAGALADPDVAAHLFDARVPAQAKRKSIETLARGLQPLTANFLRLLQDKNRLEVLRELRAAFRRFVLEERNATEGLVESPRPLAAAELGQLGATLGGVLGKTVELQNTVCPELIAGVRVFIDNKLIDQSAAGRLDRLRGRLMNARLA